MFERILVPLDGSSRSLAILPQVRRLLPSGSPELVLLRVQEKYLTPEHEKHNPQWFDWSADLIQKNLWSLEGKLRERDVNARSLFRQGKPADVILETAAELDVSLVAMSTHGYGAALRWAFGSVTDKVLTRSRYPLFLTHCNAPAATTEAEALFLTVQPIRRILVPLDGELPARSVTRIVAEIARRHDAEVTLFHVRAPVHWISEADSGVVRLGPNDFLAAEREFLEEGQIKVRCGSSTGAPAQEILGEVQAQGHELIAMSTHGRHGFARWLYGNVADLVMRHAQVPSLIVPHGDENDYPPDAS